MRYCCTVVVSAFVLATAVPTLASPHTRRGPTCQHLSGKKSPATRKPLALRGIDSDRTTQIQTALIGQGYLEGSPTGTWSPETQDALRKFQADNGWQTKMIPDARAIIKLGLGPGPVPSDVASAGTAAAAAPSSSDTESLSVAQQ